MTDAECLAKAEEVVVPVAAVVDDMRIAGVRDPIRVAHMAVVALCLECDDIPGIAAWRAEILATPPAPADAPPSLLAEAWDACLDYRRPLAHTWVRLRAAGLSNEDIPEILFQALRLVDVGRQMARLTS